MHVVVFIGLLLIAAFGKGKPISCEPQTCTVEQYRETGVDIDPVPVNMGDHHDKIPEITKEK